MLEVKREATSGWALPGTFLREGERLADAVRRSLQTKAGVAEVEPHQLHVFDALDRDDRGWVLSVAHWAVVPPERLVSRFVDTTRLVSIDRPGRLIYDHPSIVAAAVSHIRSRYDEQPDPDRLLGETFTMLQLRRVHEAVGGELLDRDAFRRQMKDRLIGTGEMSEGTRGRPAELFRRAKDDLGRRSRR